MKEAYASNLLPKKLAAQKNDVSNPLPKNCVVKQKCILGCAGEDGRCALIKERNKHELVSSVGLIFPTLTEF